MINKLQSKLVYLSDTKFGILIFILALIRVGVSPIGTEWLDWLFKASEAYPKTESYLSYSPLPILLSKLLQINNYFVWWALFTAILLISVILTLIVIKQIFKNHYREVQIIFLMSPMVGVNFTMIGHYDNLFMIGVILQTLTSHNLIVTLAAIISTGANPNLALASGLILLIMGMGGRRKQIITHASIWIAISFFTLLANSLLLEVPESGTRESIVLGQLSFTLKGVAGKWYLDILSIYGPLAVVFLYSILRPASFFSQLKPINRFLIVFGLFILPSSMSLLILDHTRIGVAAVTAALFLYLKIEFNHTNFTDIKEGKSYALSILFIIWLCTPPIIIDSGGVLRLPYEKFLNLFV